MFKAINPYAIITGHTDGVHQVRPATRLADARFWISRAPGGCWCGPESAEIKLADRKDYVSAAEVYRRMAGVLAGLVQDAREGSDLIPRPWAPGDPVRRWFLPYLVVASLEDLAQRLGEDLRVLEAACATSPGPVGAPKRAKGNV